MLSSKNGNIENGNIEFNFENGNIDSKTGSNGVKTWSQHPLSSSAGGPHPPTHGGPRLTPCRCYRHYGFDLTATPFFDDNIFRCNPPLPKYCGHYQNIHHLFMLYSIRWQAKKILVKDSNILRLTLQNRRIMPMGKGHEIEEGFGNIFGISFSFQIHTKKRLKQDCDKL